LLSHAPVSQATREVYHGRTDKGRAVSDPTCEPVSHGNEIIFHADADLSDTFRDSFSVAVLAILARRICQMNPAKANTKGPSQVEVISSAIETSLGGLLTALFKKEHYVDVKLFPRGVELIEVQAKVGLPNAPLVDFQLKIAGPGPHAGAAIAG
jgi:hypothetical protein